MPDAPQTAHVVAAEARLVRLRGKQRLSPCHPHAVSRREIGPHHPAPDLVEDRRAVRVPEGAEGRVFAGDHDLGAGVGEGAHVHLGLPGLGGHIGEPSPVRRDGRLRLVPVGSQVGDQRRRIADPHETDVQSTLHGGLPQDDPFPVPGQGLDLSGELVGRDRERIANSGLGVGR